MDQLLQGQTAIVTGAGSPAGIGFAIARSLLSSGARVAITSTTERIHERARELDASGKNVIAIVADLTEESAARLIVDVVMERSGRIDVQRVEPGQEIDVIFELRETGGHA